MLTPATLGSFLGHNAERHKRGDEGIADGFCVDEAGRIWSSMPVRLLVLLMLVLVVGPAAEKNELVLLTVLSERAGSGEAGGTSAKLAAPRGVPGVGEPPHAEDGE